MLKGGGRLGTGVDETSVGDGVLAPVRVLSGEAGGWPDAGVGVAMAAGVMHPKTRKINIRVNKKSLLGRMDDTPIFGKNLNPSGRYRGYFFVLQARFG